VCVLRHINLGGTVVSTVLLDTYYDSMITPLKRPCEAYLPMLEGNYLTG